MDDAGHAYHAALLKVLDALHKVTAAALGLDADFFAPFYAPSAKCSLRLAYYPPLSTTQQTSSAVRYGAHTDYTGYTILCQDDNDVGALDAGGLQVLLKSGQWAAVTPRRNAFVVNIGDLYEVWTNGRWRSTVHRVMKPPSGSKAATQPRLSIPFFHGPPRRRPDLVPADVRVLHRPGEVRARVGGEHLRRSTLAVSWGYQTA